MANEGIVASFDGGLSRGKMAVGPTFKWANFMMQKVIFRLDLALLHLFNHLPLFVFPSVPGRCFELLRGYVMPYVCQPLPVFAVGVLINQLFRLGATLTHYIYNARQLYFNWLASLSMISSICSFLFNHYAIRIISALPAL